MWMFTLMKVCFVTNQRYVHIHMYVHSLKSDTSHTSHQNNYSRPTTQEVWVFGMVDTSISPALGDMEKFSGELRLLCSLL